MKSENVSGSRLPFEELLPRALKIYLWRLVGITFLFGVSLVCFWILQIALIGLDALKSSLFLLVLLAIGLFFCLVGIALLTPPESYEINRLGFAGWWRDHVIVVEEGFLEFVASVTWRLVLMLPDSVYLMPIVISLTILYIRAFIKSINLLIERSDMRLSRKEAYQGIDEMLDGMIEAIILQREKAYQSVLDLEQILRRANELRTEHSDIQATELKTLIVQLSSLWVSSADYRGWHS